MKILTYQQMLELKKPVLYTEYFYKETPGTVSTHVGEMAVAREFHEKYFDDTSLSLDICLEKADEYAMLEAFGAKTLDTFNAELDLDSVMTVHEYDNDGRYFAVWSDADVSSLIALLAEALPIENPLRNAIESITEGN